VRWLRKVEDTLEEIQVAQELRVRCATQLLSDRAHSWWDIVRSRRPIGSWTWAEFWAQFESQYYSSQHQRIKAQEFLTLTQGDMAVLEYERRFHDLSMFAPYIVPTEQHRIQKMRDGLRQDLKQALIPHRFETTRELIDATEALETCMKEGQQGQSELGKRKEFEFTTGRPPFF